MKAVEQVTPTNNECAVVAAWLREHRACWEGIGQSDVQEVWEKLNEKLASRTGGMSVDAIAVQGAEWKHLFWEVARALKCLPSSFTDGNEHVLKKAAKLQAMESAMFAAAQAPKVAESESHPAPVQEGWKTIQVNSAFDALMTALDRAERKGYLPDAMSDEYEAFDYRDALTGEPK
jgi:hypothetical protein